MQWLLASCFFVLRILLLGAAQVFAIPDDSMQKIILNETSHGHFTGKVKTTSSPLRITAVFDGERGQEENKEEELLEYKVTYNITGY